MLPIIQPIVSLLSGIARGVAIGRCWKRWDENFEFDGRLVLTALVLIAFAINPGAPT